MIERRALLRGMVAMPAIVAVGSLMPIRGIVMSGAPRGFMVRCLIRDLTDAGVFELAPDITSYTLRSVTHYMIDGSVERGSCPYDGDAPLLPDLPQ